MFATVCQPNPHAGKCVASATHSLLLDEPSAISGVRRVAGPDWLPGASWWEVADGEGALDYEIPDGLPARVRWLWFDLLVDCSHQAKHTFVLECIEPDTMRTYRLTYAALPYCQSRLRFDLGHFDQDRLWLPREAGLLKPTSRGDRVRPEHIHLLRLRIERVGPPLAPLRWQQGTFHFQGTEPARLEDPLLPRGRLVDALGQYTQLTVRRKLRGIKELVPHLRRQSVRLKKQIDRSRWGGASEALFTPTGFFRREHDGKRWWLVDPDGHPFWSAGLCAVNLAPGMPIPGLRAACPKLPSEGGRFADAWRQDRNSVEPSYNFLIANFIRAFGRDWERQWLRMTTSGVARLGFNTLGNWSHPALGGMPFVVQLPQDLGGYPKLFRDFPDVFDPRFESIIRDVAEQTLRPHAHDPRLLGYFLQNEAHWAFAEEVPAQGMLYREGAEAARRALADFLDKKHGNLRQLQRVWGVPLTWEDITTKPWRHPLSEVALGDLTAFSTIMVDRYYGILSSACREVLPNHLNLGARFPGIPRSWIWPAMRHLDVFSVNYYKRRIRPEIGALSTALNLPILIGEWQFGSFESNSPGVANQSLLTEEDRAMAYRIYFESAAADPACVGAHYFRLYDNPPLGRHDGENYSIGFYDHSHRLYSKLARGAITSHRRLYALASGAQPPMQPSPDFDNRTTGL